MGGKDTEVGQGTKNILLEAAVFDPVLVRRGRQKLGIQSEASYRFERGVPLEIVEGASCRAEALIRALCSGTGAGMTAKGGSGGKAKTITLDFAAVEKALGCAISPAAIKKILACLGFGVSGAGKKSFNIAIPCHRPDARSGVDLVEEIARVYGYEAVPSALPALIPQPVRERKPFGLIKECLRGQGFDEVITFSLVDRRWLGGKFDEKELIAVTNPLSNEQELLRPTLIPSLARCVSYNLNQRHAAVAIFEVAKSYRAPDKETNVLCLAASGTFTRWFGPEEGNVSYRAGFLALKGCLEALYKTLAISGEPRYEVKDEYEIEVVTRNGKIGMLHKLRPEELSLFDIKDRDVFLAEIDLDLLLPMASSAKKVEAFSRFPRVTRDITLELNASVPVNDILIASRKAGGELMRSVAFKDYYDKNLPAGTKRATISCQYGSLTRTLTDAEVNAAHSGVVEALKKGFSCRIA
jgi:phenylalanyl-tRNA synthetase beta chain